MNNREVIIMACGTALAANAALAQPAQFIPLGFLPGNSWTQATAISADGTVVVGRALGSPTRGFRWTSTTGIQALATPAGFADAEPYAVSADGAVIAGDCINFSGSACMWTPPAVQALSGLLGALSCGASGVSANGAVIVGSSYSGPAEAVRWIAGVPHGLGDLPGGDFNSHANAASADGSVIVGFGESASGIEAFRWTQAGGMQGLGDLPGGNFYSFAQSTSADGAVVVGWGNGPPSTLSRAFRWTAGGGMQDLGTLPGAPSSAAFGVNAAGDLVVGESPFMGPGPRACVWTAGTGMIELRARLLALGATGLDGWTLDRATGVSADGTRIVGYGDDPAGHGQAWLAIIPRSASCYPDCNGSGALTVADFGCFQGKFVLGDLYADCNAGGTLTVADFGCFQGKYVLGCP
ncbi:MAG: PEP-CTERM sorting domain-containing protein [Phycisphaerales bacterium]